MRSLLSRVEYENKIDILILAECANVPSEILTELNQNVTNFHFPFSTCGSIRIFTAFPRKCTRIIKDNYRSTFRRIKLPLREEILLVSAHLPSKLRWRDNSQEHEVISLADDIRAAEKKVEHRRTVLVGDFNMQPFEDGMTSSKGLHGVMSKQVASRGSRIVQGREYPFFYNPMCGLMGDLSEGPPGSYYYDAAQHVEHYWWMFDQVLVRPELATNLGENRYRLLTKIGNESLVDGKGRPNSQIGSDHLPLYFEIDF